MLLKYHIFGNQLFCHLISVWPNPEVHANFLPIPPFTSLSSFPYIYLPYFLFPLLSLYLILWHTCMSSFPSFHLSLRPWRCFPPWSKVGLYHSHLTRLPETTKKERLLIGVTVRWKTVSVEIRYQCDANKACIQWLQSPKGPLFSSSAIKARGGIAVLYCYVWCTHSPTWPFFWSSLSWAGGLWDYTNQLLTKEVNNSSK